MNIENYDFGEITIDGKIYHHDVIIYKDKVDSSWLRAQGHDLAVNDLIEVLIKKPQILIIGTGESGVMRVSDKVIAEIEAKGIKVMASKTREACDLYNQLAPVKDVIAALHLTC